MATDNDATITEKIFSLSTPSIKTFQPEDLLIVDRGFRDCVSSLVNRGFIVKMPACSNQPQLTTKEGNESRFVTKVRYDVERVNGVMKMVWKIFSNTIDIHNIPKIQTDFEIGAALINKKTKPAVDETKSVAYAREMRLRMNKENTLKSVVNTKEFEKLIKMKKYEQFNNFNECPTLTLSDLEMISLGSYQIAQSRCYLSNHLYDNDKNLNIYRFFEEDVKRFCGEIIQDRTNTILLIMDIKSRFVSQKTHRVFVLFDTNQIGYQSILQYYCSCKVGSRTVGCCSHTMTLLNFVCYAPNNGGVKEVSKHLKTFFEENNWVDELGESDDEDELH